jgi:hypothetical protein
MRRANTDLQKKLALVAIPIFHDPAFNWVYRRNYSTDSALPKFFGQA